MALGAGVIESWTPAVPVGENFVGSPTDGELGCLFNDLI